MGKCVRSHLRGWADVGSPSHTTPDPGAFSKNYVFT